MSNNHRTVKNVTRGVLNRVFAFFARHLFPAQLRMPFYKAMGVKVGKGTKIAATVDIDMSAPELITIGKDVWVTRGVMLLCHQRDLSYYEIGKPVMDCPLKYAPINIKDGAHIGIGSIIMPGVTIGEGAVIGAGSVVTRDIPPCCVAAGVPAKVIKTFQHKENQSVMICLFELNHPKHYYQFKHVMQQLKNDGHKVHVLARDKDVLLKVLDEENVPYEIFGLHKKSIVGKIFGTISILINYKRIARRIKPDVIISKASFYGTYTARRIGAKSIIFPDSEVVRITNKYVVPLCDKVVTPETFGLDYGGKHIKVPGFFENCYLAPSVFTPDEKVLADYGLKRPYAVFRFVGWFANHDVHNGGFTLDEKIELVKAVEPFMTVYISSEKQLPDELKKYSLPTPAAQIHSVLSCADLYLGDSQTMATEAALLGTPAIRSNSFVGEHDMTNFIILENKYGLLRNIANYDDVLAAVKDFAEHPRKKEWAEKQKTYNKQTGDCNKMIAEIIEKM